MKIAVFHELPFGGARDSVYAMSKGLVENKHTLDLYYVSEDQETSTINFYKNVYFYKFIPKVWVGNNWKSRLYKDTLELNRLNSLHKQIAKTIDSNKYDLVLVNGSEYIESPFILKFLTTFKVFYSHDPNYRLVYEKILSVDNKLPKSKIYYEKLQRKLRKYLDKQNLVKADLILSNSKYAKKVIKDTYNKDSVVAYLGVDTNFFKPNTKNKDIDILFIGSRAPIDGFDLLEESIKNLPPETIIKTIMFEDGWISDKNQIKDYYNRSKIVVCLAHNEPFGLVPLEAMASGVIVIAVNEGGYKETVINNKTGFLINRNSKELTNKIKLLLSNVSLQNKIGSQARHIAVNTWESKKRAKELSKILERQIK